MTASAIPPEVIANQAAASDPRGSAWVSANAGSGKTYVLAQRVIRLMLDGVDPSKILCLTFTKAAAANMANRVLGTLGEWATLDDAGLDAAIRRTEGRAPSPERRRHARRLFAAALETPGGLKVQTIHAFCTALLHQFPFEADVAARFEVLEERAEAELIDRLRLAVLLEAASAPETPLGRALAAAMVEAADTYFSDVVREAVGQRAAIEAWLSRAGGLDAALAELARTLGMEADDAPESIEAEFLAGSLFPASEWDALAAVFAAGSATDREHVDRLRRAGEGTGWAHIESYLSVFCTGKLEPRKNIATRAIQKEHPALYERLVAEQQRICELLARRRAASTHARTAALMTIAAEVLARYRAEKDRRGVLDYADLIEKTLALFDNAAAAWVHYKLDLGIDHVLVDEAQDTSPQQWAVIRRLTAEFTAGEGARSHIRRSIFAVGDEKQSIYSFQGAAPRHFDAMRRLYEREHGAAGLAFAAIPFRYSFRSAPDVLGAVDTVFGRAPAFEGLSSENVATVHEAVRRQAPGHVDLWDLEAPAERVPIEAWDAPFDETSEESPVARLARRIAHSVRGMIARAEAVGDGEERRAVTPGDVLVLVRQRGSLFEAVIRALKEAGVPVAGADRLVLTEHIAVMDLVSLADALLLPEDDLALAEALKSPLFGFDDEALFALAYERKGSLRASLRARAGDEPLFAEASATLDRLAREAFDRSPFAFYAELLGSGGGRRKMLARLGPEAADALDEFLALALDYERRNTPSLQGFVAWLRAAAVEVKRDMDIARNEVRVMTVHGAKGLEAPVVFLADTTSKAEGPRSPRLMPLAGGGVGEGAQPVAWAKGKDHDPSAVAADRAGAREAAVQEHRRLLYVAMTRAADRLIVAGARGKHAEPEGCWYRLVRAALEPEAVEIATADGSILRWRKPGSPAAEAAIVGTGVAPGAPVAGDDAALDRMPDWLTRPAQPPSGGALALVPSTAGKAAGRVRPVAQAAQALLRGRLAHRLLEALPALPPERRADAARAFLARASADPGAAAAEDILGRVMAVMDDPVFAPLFAQGARGEVPLAGRLSRAAGGTVEVQGRIDRLAVTADAVLVADFKTDRAPPSKPEDVPAAHVRQLALYGAVLARLYPGRPVRAALVYTETATLIGLDAAATDGALAALGIAPA